MEDIQTMARNFYGYGRWGAPYWFIGLEQGGNNNLSRAHAFKELQLDGLVDCKEFHLKIGVSDWHGDHARLQKTWGRLMMLLASFRGDDSSEVSLLNYQQKYWGMREGDTCVIELSGLAATGLHIKVDRQSYRADRISAIRRKLIDNRPQLVVMYGFTGERQFQEIVEGKLVRGVVVEDENTLFFFADHPARQRFGNTDRAWKDLGALIQNRPHKSSSGSTIEFRH